MTSHKLPSLLASLTDRIASQEQAMRKEISSLLEAVGGIQGQGLDPRLQRLQIQLRKLRQNLDSFWEVAQSEHLDKIHQEAETLTAFVGESRSASVIKKLLELQHLSLKDFADSLLDQVVAATGAERGFLLFYRPHSTEASVVAARSFKTHHLGVAEYDPSRTLVRQVLQSGETLLLADAAKEAPYSDATSVQELGLKSVLAVPLRHHKLTLGAIYLENNSRPLAFQEDEQEVVEAVCRFAVFYLHHAHLLPAPQERKNRVFLDQSRASREIISQDAKMRDLIDRVHRVAPSSATVLIQGESGTGKELVARALHYESPRRQQKLVAINCAAIPKELLEAQLFGHERGVVFTGATKRFAGQIAQANGGTLFLDEIGEMPYALQAKLLRFLQEKEIQRLGAERPIQVDVRVVAATSRDLKAMVTKGRFQEALYYRLHVVPLVVPSLRERRQDIPLLATHFLEKFNKREDKPVEIAPEVYAYLQNYGFPGNVRELESLIESLVVLGRSNLIRLGDLPPEYLDRDFGRISLETRPLSRIIDSAPRDLEDLRTRQKQMDDSFSDQRRQLAETAVAEADGNLSKAARRLGVDRTTLYRYLR